MRIVHSLDELLILPRDRVVNGIRARAEVRLAIPDIAPTDLVLAQASLNELQARGGSIAGAAAMLLTLLYGVVLILQRHDSPWSWRAAGELSVVLGLAFGVGLAARLGACVHTRWRFARRCRHLHDILARKLAGS